MKTRILLLLLALAAPAAHGAVTVSFVTSTAVGATAQTGNTLTLDFTVSGTGVVSLDATGSNAGNAANYDQLDSANVGTVSSSAAYGKTFSFVVSATNGTGGVTSSEVSTVGLGIVGSNQGRIDWNFAGGQVSEVSTMAVNLSNLTGSTFSLSNIVVENLANGTGGVADARIKSFGGGTANYGTGSINLTAGFQVPGGNSGATIQVGQSNQPTAGSAGFSITSMTFNLVNAVPEPSSALLGGLGMLCLLRRRRA